MLTILRLGRLGGLQILRRTSRAIKWLKGAEATGTMSEGLRLPLRRKWSAARKPAVAQRVQEFERATVVAELERNHRNVTQTARALGLERSHLYKKCQQLGIDLQASRESV